MQRINCWQQAAGFGVEEAGAGVVDFDPINLLHPIQLPIQRLLFMICVF